MDTLTDVLLVIGSLAFFGSMFERWMQPRWTRRLLIPIGSLATFYFLHGLSLRSVLAGLAAAFFSVVVLHLLDSKDVKVVRRM